MNTLFKLKSSLFVATLLALPAAHAANLSETDYSAAKTRISAAYTADKASCDARTANAKDICIQEAKGKEKVARAELQYGYTGKTGDQNKVLVAKAEATYAVAKEKCDDMAGNAKDVCVKQAKAVEVHALADAKMGKEVGEATTDAAATKRDADYKLAAQKCEALAGDPKANCMTAAKAKFGQN